ncbi:MAG: glutamate racemase [Saprospiraceae bacterium]|nr:glutamate racemase [Saprospiraceae bacterium]
MSKGPIGIFDSGYGGLTILKEITRVLPQYDYIYLGDNARAPYGQRSFETIYQYTLECVQWFFNQGCPLVILACNTASAKALKNIQHFALPHMAPDNRVLGVIRPTAEVIGHHTQTRQIGILATTGTVVSGSYLIEVHRSFPELKVFQQACPMWVPMVENNEYDNEGADYYIKKYIDALRAQSPDIDTVLMACTHYPLLVPKIKKFWPEVNILSQGPIVAHSLADYLQRHPEIEARIGQHSDYKFYTTDSENDFDNRASVFFGETISATHAEIDHTIHITDYSIIA